VPRGIYAQLRDARRIGSVDGRHDGERRDRMLAW